MAKTRSMTRNENQDVSSKKMFRTCDNDDATPWSDLNHDVLYIVLMQLGVVDFPTFSGVCTSWRSFALSNKNKFMESRPPMSISIHEDAKESLSIPIDANEEDYYCYLEDTEGRTSNSILPNSGGRTCIGLTCGHLILLGRKTNDFWLLDPLTRHGVHFPDIPSSVSDDPTKIRAFLVFSPSKSRWLFVMTDGSTNIWFSISGQGTWNHVSSTFPVVDLHAFKGKMYTINNSRQLCELTLNPEPKLTLLETKKFPILSGYQRLVSSPRSLLMTGYSTDVSYKTYNLHFEDMKWVLCITKNKGASSYSKLRDSAAAKHGKSKFYYYLETYGIPHDCLNDNLIDG